MGKGERLQSMRLIDVEDIRCCRGEDIINYEEKMRLINADALYEHSFPICDDYDEAEEVDDVVSIIDINNAPTIDAVPVETVCEMFGNEAPCNYGLFGVSVDDFMMSKCGEWCEDNCGKVPYTECWRKFFEAIEKGKSHDKRRSDKSLDYTT